MKTQNNITEELMQIGRSNNRIVLLIIGLVIAILILRSGLAVAQTEELKHQKAQVTFVYPLGTNGMERDLSHDFSFNMLFGMNGGVNGFEFGGTGNYNNGEVKGFQLAGITNYTKGAVNGAQISGIANINIGPTKGFQLSTINAVQGEVTGMQLGVANYAKKMKGLQLGVVNIIGDGDEALPIGLINIVKNGYFAFETTGSETLYANFNFKMGVERFYTIFKMCYSTFDDHSVYSYGLGFGTLIHLKGRHSISADISANAIVYDGQWDEVWDDGLNMLSKLDLSYRYHVSSKISVIAGPSFNTYASKVSVNDEFGTLNTPNTVYSDDNGNRKITMWIGFHAGLALTL